MTTRAYKATTFITGTAIFGSVAFCFSAFGNHAQNDPPPNIIIIFADDQGYTDLGIHGADPDVRTPNLDQLAKDGVLFTNGYTTAPQCVPSRAGLISGRHQNAFGLETNNDAPLPYNEYTISERLRDAGYVTGMVGKWHLDGSDNNFLPHTHGFEEYFTGNLQNYKASHDLEGNPLPDPPQGVSDPRYRIDIQTLAALSFLDRRKADPRPFFLYLAYYAPHSPMEDPPQYMERMAHVEEYERRMGLASILAIDDGVGLIRRKLLNMGLTNNTLIFYISDNGAPLREGAYVGSFNTPMIGEKGMQTDGGQRVPFLAAWPERIPSGQAFEEAVWTLDATATALAIAGAPVDEKIEGENLMPWLLGEKEGPVHDAIYWRWRSQAAILSGNWKFIRLGNERRYLFDMQQAGKETAAENKIDLYPGLAAELEEKLITKASTWKVTGLPDEVQAPDRSFFNQHVDQTLPPLPLGEGTVGTYIPWDENRPATAIHLPRPFKIIANNNNGHLTTDTIQSGVFALGINDYGGGSISMVALPGIGNIMGPQALSYGRMGQSSIRSRAHGNVYNPTQAGFNEPLGTECEVTKTPGRMIVEPRGSTLWRADNKYDFTRWENIGSDGYDEFKKHGGIPGASDEDGLYEEDLEVIINGITYTKQEAEVYTEFDYYGTYENYMGKFGITTPAIRHYFEYRFIRPPGHCINQFRAGTLMWDEEQIVEDISVQNPEGVFRGTDKDMNNMTTSWSLRKDLALWKPMYRHIQKLDGTWEVITRENEQVEKDTDYKRFFIIAESDDVNSGRAIGLYQPDTEINQYSVIGVRESNGSVYYTDNRVISSFWRDEPYRTASMSWMGFRNLSNGLINRDRLPEGIYEAYRQEFYVFYGTPQEIKDAVAALDSGEDYPPDSDATLSAITWPDIPFPLEGWKGDTIPLFSPSDYSYTVKVPYGTSSVPALTAIPASLMAGIKVIRARSLTGPVAERTTTFQVTAGDDSTYKEYSVTFEIEKPDELIQKYQGHPFISEVIMRFYNRVGMLEVAHAGELPLDMSRYMFVRSTTTNPAETIFNAIPAVPTENNFKYRYTSYVPGYRYSNDTVAWINNPGRLYPDPEVNPMVEPGATFNIIACPGRHSRITNELAAITHKLWTTYDDLNTSWNDPLLDISIEHTPPHLKYNAEALFLFEVLNDSIFEGTKPVGDPADFLLVDAFGDVNQDNPWQIAGVSLADAFVGRVRLKSEYFQGVKTLGEGNGTNPDDSRWIVETQTDIGIFDNFISHFGSHTIDPDSSITHHLSTITSLIYLVSDGFAGLQSVQGDLTGVTIEQFYLNISKADPGQMLTMKNGANGSEKSREDLMAGNDTLVVVSADGNNTTKYLLIDKPLDDDASLVAKEGSGYLIEINGSTGKIKGMDYGVALREVLDNVIKPLHATLNVIETDDNLVPLLTRITSSEYVEGEWVYSYSYVDTRLEDDIFFEVVAQNRVNMITYSLEPDEPVSDVPVFTDEERLLVYPNPASDRVFVRGVSEGAVIYLTDLMGRTITVKRAEELEHGISLSAQPAGIYLITVLEDNRSIRHARLVKH